MLLDWRRNKIPVKKLGWFRKQLGAAGKRIFHWKIDKISLFSLNVFIRCLMRMYASFNDGDYEKGLNAFCKHVEEEARNLIFDIINEPILFGITMDSIISKEPEDIVYIATTLFWAMIGKDYKDLWEQLELVKEDNGAYKLTMREKICIICSEETQLTQDMLGSRNFGDIFASLLVGILQALEEFVGNKYQITGKETKCMLKGDSHGEISIWMTPTS
ncbi:MAG: hypothetical protein EAX96_19775 [Candidatus Lokiarchaeota archaeon]|nr:hypothetical protein [Candidatus Lokiarchaeota archaeon]